MLNSCFKKAMAFIIFFMVSGCAPLVPDNYLTPNTVEEPQKVNGRWVPPKIIQISNKMLNTPEGQALLAPAMQPQPYHVGPFDSLHIIVWGHPELSTLATNPNPTVSGSSIEGLSLSSTANPTILVQTDGTIFYPYVGHIQVAGLTINGIQQKITGRLSAYIRNPQVTVQVAEFRNRNIHVLGEVITPGMFPLKDKPLTLMEAISKAGGINSASADPTHIYLIRGSFQKPQVFWLNATTPQSLMIAQRFPLRENDIVYIPAATFNAWNRFVNTVFPTFTTYWTIKGLSK